MIQTLTSSTKVMECPAMGGRDDLLFTRIYEHEMILSCILYTDETDNNVHSFY